jgi:hypothetical protein
MAECRADYSVIEIFERNAFLRSAPDWDIIITVVIIQYALSFFWALFTLFDFQSLGHSDRWEVTGIAHMSFDYRPEDAMTIVVLTIFSFIIKFLINVIISCHYYVNSRRDDQIIDSSHPIWHFAKVQSQCQISLFCLFSLIRSINPFSLSFSSHKQTPKHLLPRMTISIPHSPIPNHPNLFKSGNS